MVDFAPPPPAPNYVYDLCYRGLNRVILIHTPADDELRCHQAAQVTVAVLLTRRRHLHRRAAVKYMGPKWHYTSKKARCDMREKLLS
jgi:hypothetical protein